VTIRASTAKAKIGAVALGNEASGDDGAGPFVLKRVMDRVPNAWLRNLGPDLLRIQSHYPYPDHLIILDAARSGASPGTVHRLSEYEVNKARIGVHAHGIGPTACLRLLLQGDRAFASIEREWILVEAGDCDRSFQLTPEVEEACLQLVEELVDRLTT
jgi:hydrogenase maturation protease